VKRAINVAVVVGAVAFAACSEAGAPVSEVVVADSAGVRIVTNPMESEALPWVVGDAPLVSIGGAAASEEEQLFGVRGAARLSDGRIVVANGGTHELRFFSADGGFLSASGAEGEGPGEFVGIWIMYRLPGDTLLVYDQRSSYLRTIDRERTAEVQFSSVVGFYADGSQLGQNFVNTGGELPSGLQRFMTDLYHFGTDGTLLAQLGPYMLDETYFVPLEGGGLSFWDPVFGRQSYRLAAGDRFLYADNETFDIQLRESDGSLRMVIRRAGLAPAVEAHHIEGEKERRVEEQTDENALRELERILAEIPIPDRFPAHGDIVHDARGLLWVEVYRLPGDETQRWEVFGPDGVLMGQVTFPEVLDTVYEIGEDYVLGLARDELDVESVRIYGLMRGEG
jgi:hypothetical protein